MWFTINNDDILYFPTFFFVIYLLCQIDIKNIEGGGNKTNRNQKGDGYAFGNINKIYLITIIEQNWMIIKNN